MQKQVPQPCKQAYRKQMQPLLHDAMPVKMEDKKTLVKMKWLQSRTIIIFKIGSDIRRFASVDDGRLYKIEKWSTTRLN